MQKYYPINLKIQGAHLPKMINECINIQKNQCIHFLEHVWTKSCSQKGDRQTDGPDRQKDGQDETNIAQNFDGGGCNTSTIQKQKQQK